MAPKPSTVVIHHTMVGKTYLRMQEAKTIGCKDPLPCYKGSLHYGNADFSVNATILAFEPCDGEYMCKNLSSINSEFVLNVLTSVHGTNGKSGIMFVAFPIFHKTYSSYIEKGSDSTVEKGRLTEEFIKLTKDVIQGFMVLHRNGFYCPNFKGQHVAVMCEGGMVAKIWNFCLAETKEDKFRDWGRLADKIEEAATNHGLVSLEVKDLCDKMRTGVLVGVGRNKFLSEALKHCALLTVMEKFNKILALNYHVLRFCKGQQLPTFDSLEKNEVHAALLEFLAKDCHWTMDMPQWIVDVNNSRHQATPRGESGETFIWVLRSVIEHEELYEPPKITDGSEGSNKDDPDLESELRRAWQELFLKVLNFATKLELKY